MEKNKGKWWSSWPVAGYVQMHTGLLANSVASKYGNRNKSYLWLGRFKCVNACFTVTGEVKCKSSVLVLQKALHVR
jgi:hypothetical protein